MSRALETRCRQGAATTQYWVGRTEYEVDFVEMTQHGVNDRGRVRKVRRVDADPMVTRQPSPLQVDHLSDAFFWTAFREAMRQVGMTVTVSANEVFDFSRNRDYSSLTDNGHTMLRGGQPYKIPIGWKRFAVKVAGKFDNGDNTWMKMNGTPGEWAVAYHGTKHAHLANIIVKEGLKPGPGQGYASSCGVGIYCTPDLALAQGYSAGVSVTHGGQTHTLSFILQCRVQPSAIRVGAPNVWVINNANDIRPYGVLVR